MNIARTSAPSTFFKTNTDDGGCLCNPFCGSSDGGLRRDASLLQGYSGGARQRKNPEARASPIFSAPSSQTVVHPVSASELAQLSAEERNIVYEDIHGVLDVRHEHPEMIDRKLEEMKIEIRKVKERSAYNKALFLAPSKISRPAFHLMFLRAEMFNPRRAARRLVSHFHYKALLFGREKVSLCDGLGWAGTTSLSIQYLGYDLERMS